MKKRSTVTRFKSVKDYVTFAPNTPPAIRAAVERAVRRALPKVIASADLGGRPNESLDRRLLARKFSSFRKLRPGLATVPALKAFLRSDEFKAIEHRVSARAFRSLLNAERAGRKEREKVATARKQGKRARTTYMKAVVLSALGGRLGRRPVTGIAFGLKK